MRLSYGLYIAAALIAGGTAIYYGTGRSTLTAPDVVELLEGYNERCAARAALPFTGNTNDGWSFTAYPTQNAVFAWSTMASLMTNIQALAPSYVRTYTATSVTYWSVTSLWDHLHIGDGTNLWTVGIATNGLPIYSNAPRSTIWTGLLWECYRALAEMTTTVASVTWLEGPTYFTNALRDELYLGYYEGPFTNGAPTPAWFTNFALLAYFESNDVVSGFAITNAGTNGTPITYFPVEECYYYGNRDAWRLADYDAATNWTYYGYLTNAGWSLARYATSGQVAIANLAVGVTAAVEWCMSADVTVEVLNYTPSGLENYTITNALVWGTNWAGASIVHDGVSTSVWDRFTPDTWPRLADIIDPSTYTATGHLQDDVSSWTPKVCDSYTRDYWPYLRMRMEVDGVAIVHWTFTRCRPAP